MLLVQYESQNIKVLTGLGIFNYCPFDLPSVSEALSKFVANIRLFTQTYLTELKTQPFIGIL
jgi:hypothetical protein